VSRDNIEFSHHKIADFLYDELGFIHIQLGEFKNGIDIVQEAITIQADSSDLGIRPKYVIEREMPQVGTLSDAELRGRYRNNLARY